MGAKVERPQPKGDGAHKIVPEKPWIVMVLSLSALIVSLLPVLAVTYPLQIDIPNHLARHFIAQNIGLSEDLSRFYEFEWRAYPYLAGDGLHQLLNEFFSVYDSNRVVLAFAFVSWLSCAQLLYRALWGSFSVWPLLCVLLFFNANIVWGFENYIIGSSFALLIFTGWVSWNTERIFLKAIIFTILATFLYFMHLFAFAAFGVLYLTYEVGGLWNVIRSHPIRAIGRLSIITLPMWPGTLHFLSMVIFSKAAALGGTRYGGEFTPFQALVASFSSGFSSLAIDPAILPVILGCLLFLFSWGYLTRTLRIHPRMVLLLVILGVLCLIAPFRLAGVALVHFRLPFIFVLLLIASSRWEGVQPTRYWSAVAALSLLILVRSLMVTDAWQVHDTEVRELVKGFEKLERGATLLPVVSNGESSHAHSAAFAVIERDAYVPSLFTGITPLKVRPGIQEIRFGYAAPHHIESLLAAREAAKAGKEPPEEILRQWWCHFSHILVIDREASRKPFPDQTRLIHEGSFFALYRNETSDPRCQSE